jgi:DNA-binding transcriptional LysR family regulator
MSPLPLDDLTAFLAVVEEASFTRAARRLGLSQSALSHKINALEVRLGLRLLSRTTRSVAPTAAGARLAERIGPRLGEISAELLALGDLRDRPAGMIRLNAGDHVVDSVLLPKLKPFLAAYPEIEVEIVVDQGLTDIVTERFDAGIRLGEHLHRDMVAVRISPDFRMGVFAAPEYFADHSVPEVPQDLTAHRCLNLRLTSQGGLYAWEFQKDGQALSVRVEGPMIFNRTAQIVEAALLGIGIAFVPPDRAERAVAEGRLVAVLQDWWPRFEGYHLYYPSRRQPSAAFSLLVEALRWRGTSDIPK